MLLSLQEILGDLLVPLSRSEFAGEHYRLTMMASRERQRRQRELNHCHQKRRTVLQRRNQPEPHADRGEQQKQRGEDAATDAAVSENATTAAIATETGTAVTSGISLLKQQQQEYEVNGCVLEPEAKLLLRMAVYRLILLDGK